MRNGCDNRNVALFNSQLSGESFFYFRAILQIQCLLTLDDGADAVVEPKKQLIDYRIIRWWMRTRLLSRQRE